MKATGSVAVFSLCAVLVVATVIAQEEVPFVGAICSSNAQNCANCTYGIFLDNDPDCPVVTYDGTEYRTRCIAVNGGDTTPVGRVCVESSNSSDTCGDNGHFEAVDPPPVCTQLWYKCDCVGATSQRCDMNGCNCEGTPQPSATQTTFYAVCT